MPHCPIFWGPLSTNITYTNLAFMYNNSEERTTILHSQSDEEDFSYGR